MHDQTVPRSQQAAVIYRLMKEGYNFHAYGIRTRLATLWQVDARTVARTIEEIEALIADEERLVADVVALSRR